MWGVVIKAKERFLCKNEITQGNMFEIDYVMR